VKYGQKNKHNKSSAKEPLEFSRKKTHLVAIFTNYHE